MSKMDNFKDGILKSDFPEMMKKELSRDVTRVGVAYDFQVLDLVPHTGLDKSVQFVITETKILRCRNIYRIEV